MEEIIWIEKLLSIDVMWCPSMHQEKPKMFAKGTEINTVVVVKKLHEILQARGKKGTDR